MSTIQIGIIGIGWWSTTRHVPRLQQMDGVEVAAISRRNPEALRDAQEALGIQAAYTDWRELIERPGLDAVIVSTPHYAHLAPAVAALQRGLHVLVEKPMALTSQDAWAMVHAAENAGRVLAVGYNARYMGAWRAAARTLEEGALGTVRQVSLAAAYNLQWLWQITDVPEAWIEAEGIPRSFLGESMEGYWRRNPEQMGGGEFADWGTHWVDLALWLAGAPPVEVVALAESAGLSVETSLGVQARLANGVLLSLSSVDGVPSPQNRLTVYGDRGILTADWTDWDVGDGAIALHRPEGSEPLKVDIPDTTSTAAFVDTIRDGAPNLAPARDGAYAVSLTEAAYRSIEEKRIVRVEQPG